MKEKIKFVEDYLDNNLRINFEAIYCGSEWIDISVGCIPYTIPKSKYNKLMSILENISCSFDDKYIIKFSYDVSGYEYFYENKENNQLFITVSFNNILNIDKHFLDEIILGIYSCVDIVNQYCISKHIDFMI